MASKRAILDEFYTAVDRKQVKIETLNHGYDYLRTLDNAANVDYCELKKGVYKYRLSNLKKGIFAQLLEEHIAKNINLCTYLHKDSNNLLAFNLDSSSKSDNKLKIMALYLTRDLINLGIPPLIIKSGHGYHFWCRISAPVKNSELQTFMSLLVQANIAQINQIKLDASDLQCTCYPRPYTNDISIRLFGSNHMGTRKFSYIATKLDTIDTLLSEEESWYYFERFINEGTVSRKSFANALTELKNVSALG